MNPARTNDYSLDEEGSGREDTALRIEWPLSRLARENFCFQKVKTPYDVFLVHSGEDKQNVRMIDAKLSSMGYRCFLDNRELEEHGCKPQADKPVTYMAESLQSCRHVVVFMSRTFLKKRYPCAELQYAYERMQWLRKHHKWQSLWVITYDLSVDSYKEVYNKSGKEMPPLHYEIQMLDFIKGNSRGVYASLLHLVDDLSQRIRSCDAPPFDESPGAAEMWMRFLEEWPDHDGFPLANRVYDPQYTKPKSFWQNLKNTLSKERMRPLQPFFIALCSSLATILAMERPWENDDNRRARKKISARKGFWLLTCLALAGLGLSKFGPTENSLELVEKFNLIQAETFEFNTNPAMTVSESSKRNPLHDINWLSQRAENMGSLDSIIHQNGGFRRAGFSQGIPHGANNLAVVHQHDPAFVNILGREIRGF